jgi:hypothetical protein
VTIPATTLTVLFGLSGGRLNRIEFRSGTRSRVFVRLVFLVMGVVTPTVITTILTTFLTWFLVALSVGSLGVGPDIQVSRTEGLEFSVRHAHMMNKRFPGLDLALFLELTFHSYLELSLIRVVVLARFRQVVNK